MDRSACKGLDPDLFMPVRGENIKIKIAKQICAECPVIIECREYSLQLAQLYDTHGIFGGWTRQQRTNELRRRGLTPRRWVAQSAIQRHGTNLAYVAHQIAGENPCQECQRFHAANQMVI